MKNYTRHLFPSLLHLLQMGNLRPVKFLISELEAAIGLCRWLSMALNRIWLHPLVLTGTANILKLFSVE